MTGILINSDGDLKVNTTPVNGLLPGIEIGNNTGDIIQRVLDAHPGEFKSSPLLGANIRTMLGGSGSEAFVSSHVLYHVKMANVDVNNVLFNNGELEITYED
jgi:hypothetical protein